MPELFLQSIMLAVVRHLLGAAGATVGTLGFVSNDAKMQATGIAVGILATLWSMVQKAGRPVIAGWLRQYADRLNPPDNPIVSAPPVDGPNTVSRFR